ncbi:hypothetical protein ACFQ1S_42220 [Kibdelosporangium lantanae]|uniref:HAD family phosphatase n=1 Tax=Kibdelosporangium lantanae TaxID=1497396 RepID=A0ABW3MQG2_9PSEU
MDKTVVFDVDGTLVDTNYHHTIAWFRAFQKQGVAVPWTFGKRLRDRC